jgi:hypothetical protein
VPLHPKLPRDQPNTDIRIAWSSSTQPSSHSRILVHIISSLIMSSLAGALEEPVRHNYSYSSAHPAVIPDQDVQMEPKNNEPEVKEEHTHTSMGGLAVAHLDDGDEEMEDLFGLDADVEASKPDRDVKSER